MKYLKNTINGFITGTFLFTLAKLLFETSTDMHDSEKSLSTDLNADHQEKSKVEYSGPPDEVIYHESIEYIAMKVLTEQYGYPEPLEKAISKLVSARYSFTPRELDQIFAIKNCYFNSDKSTIAFQFAEAGFVFPIDKLLKNQNPSCDGGWTVAHEMASQKYNFSVKDLLALGNPSDIRDLSISDIMALNGHAFTKAEKRQLGINDSDFNYTACATYIEEYQNKIYKPIANSCIECGGEFYSKDISALNPNYTYPSSITLHECTNCHWWVVDEILCEVDGGMSWDIRVLLIGVPKPHIPGFSHEQEPWKKFLFDSKFLRHSMPISGEIMKLFT